MRAACITRFGEGTIPDPGTVLQEGDLARTCSSRAADRSTERRDPSLDRPSPEDSRMMHAKRVAIAGAGNVGRSIANELLDHGHEVLLIERGPAGA